MVRRRKVLRNLGAASLGFGVVGQTTAEGEGQEIEEITGRERRRVAYNAYRSEQMWFVRKYFKHLSGGRPSFDSAYRISSDDFDGYLAEWHHEEHDAYIQYYETVDGTPVGQTSTPGGESNKMVFGAIPDGDGVISVDGELENIAHSGQTSLVTSIQTYLNNTSYKHSENSGLNETNGLFIMRPDEDDRKGEYRVPAEDDQLDEYNSVELEATTSLISSKSNATRAKSNSSIDWSISSRMDSEKIAAKESDNAGTLDHEVCSGFYCVDPCKLFCGTKAAAGGAGCGAVCAGSVVAAKLTVGCAAFCTALVGGVCYPTCMSKVDH